MWEEFVSLFYPRVCICCNKTLITQENQFCLACRFSLPRTNYHTDSNNPLFKKLSNTSQINSAFAFLKYQRRGATQKILRELKYNGNKEVGHLLGSWYGSELAASGYNDRFDIAVAIPLHKNKLRRRGYNQSESLAIGISEQVGAVYLPDLLIRNVDTVTQTKKHKVQRWENTANIFSTNLNHTISGKRILLIDDVITTGATVESAIQALWLSNPASISVGGLATGQ
jgi:ComF family protein